MCGAARERRVVVGHCLVVAGVTAVVAGALLAGLANIPGDGVDGYRRTGNRYDAYPQLGRLAAGLAGAALVWVWVLPALLRAPWHGNERWRWMAGLAPGRVPPAERTRWVKRLVANVVLAAAGLVALVLVTVWSPAPGQRGGPDLSFPLMQVAAAAVVAGAVGTAVGSLRWRPEDSPELPRHARRAAGVGSVAAVVLVLAAVAALLVPFTTVRRNTVAAPASAPPAERAPALDGTVAWSVVTGEASGRGSAGVEAFRQGMESVSGLFNFDPTRTALVGTAGGLGVLEARGVRMLDPVTGAVRWSYRRWDARHFGPRHRRNGLDTGTAAVSHDRRWLAMTMFVDTPRNLFIDDLRASTRVWVLDTVSGSRRVDAAVPDGARVEAVIGGRVVISDGWTLSMLDRDGSTAWRRPGAERCEPVEEAETDGDVLAFMACDDFNSAQLWRVDAGSGAVEWAHPLPPIGTRRISLAVAGSTAVVSVGAQLLGVDVADGRRIWDRWVTGAERPGESERGPVVRARSGVVVVASDQPDRRGVAVDAFDAATGTPSWTTTLPGTRLTGYGRAGAVGSAAMLPDGRYLLAYRDDTDEATCMLGVWDAATGARREPLALHAGGRRQQCERSGVALVPTPTAVAARATSLSAWLAVLS